MLEVSHLTVNYGSIKGVNDISFHVEEGEIVTLIGSNGAGTSTLRALSGLNKSGTGTSIKFMGEELTKLTPHQIVARGLNHVPEGRRIFYSMTVKENLLMGAWIDKNQAVIRKNMERAYTLFPRLKERENQLGGTLSGGEQQRVSIARALAKNPKLLLCDEPTGALDSKTSREILILLEKINARYGTTMLIVTHNNSIKQMVHRVIFLKDGQIKKSYTNETRVPADKLEDL